MTDLEREKNAVDIVTNSMFSLDFLEGITDVIFSEQRDSMTVGHFYDEWLKASGVREKKIPFSLGAIIGYLYCGILFAKEHWFEMLPDVDFIDANPKWGISGAPFSAPKKEKPSLKYVIRRVRNALGHGNINVNVPRDLKDRTDRMTRVTIEFCDRNNSDPSDTFHIELSLKQLSTFVRAFQSLIHNTVRSK